MAKRKISATVSAERIEQAKAVTGSSNLSELIERGLAALVERELESRWIEGYRRELEVDLPGATPVDLTDVPWETA
ncbi:MAG: type II toxin-antitoxin system CcdA family antitoxin [Nitriliruptor sp.]|uniref:type II toxin-antitoxin system CcdA family antitoxin n=1 Tax=Nitriliruptor sp. TaxID=2448056 RepID=UPI0034A054A9